MARWLVSVDGESGSHTNGEPGASTDDANHQPLHQKNPSHRRRRQSHGFQDADFAGFVTHHHGQRAYDIEGGNDDNQQENQPHPQLLEVEGTEQRTVLFVPVDGVKWETQ